MILLSLFYLLSTFTVIESTCSMKAPRKEGFARYTCIPGFYDGSCLTIIETQTLHAALDKCRYYYGGRLATAPTKEAIQLWRRTIHFDTRITLNENTRFWVGYGATSDGSYLGFKYEEPNKEMQKFINLTMWHRVFGKRHTHAFAEWETGANTNLLQFSFCPNYGVVFNPNNMKFDVKPSYAKHYALCETPRWAKLQCDVGWHLLPQLRMCLKVHETYAYFKVAHDICRQEKSFMSVTQNAEEIEMFRAVILQYRRPPQSNWVYYETYKAVPSFWTGLKSLGKKTFSLDGTNSSITVDTEEENNNCETHSYVNFTSFGKEYSGTSIPCEESQIPYMCQRFADQSLTVNL